MNPCAEIAYMPEPDDTILLALSLEFSERYWAQVYGRNLRLGIKFQGDIIWIASISRYHDRLSVYCSDDQNEDRDLQMWCDLVEIDSIDRVIAFVEKCRQYSVACWLDDDYERIFRYTHAPLDDSTRLPRPSRSQ